MNNRVASLVNVWDVYEDVLADWTASELSYALDGSGTHDHVSDAICAKPWQWVLYFVLTREAHAKGINDRAGLRS